MLHFGLPHCAGLLRELDDGGGVRRRVPSRINMNLREDRYSQMVHVVASRYSNDLRHVQRERLGPHPPTLDVPDAVGRSIARSKTLWKGTRLATKDELEREKQGAISTAGWFQTAQAALG
ncbi:MAG: hypothetical protein IPQ07_36870 [Myxococcales bacterium]|nr:hypothetical protein [Myxococcales bacterium]